MEFEKLFPENLYHSYIVEGDPTTTPLLLRKFLEERGDITQNSVDVLCQIYDSFSISDSPLIKEWHSECGITKGKKVCILGAKFINHDAERTLLKILEEPKPNTHFFIIVPNSLMLLDTIRSRVHIVKVSNANEKSSVELTKEFLVSSVSDRIKIVSQIIEDNKKNEDSANVRFQAIAFLNNLEAFVYEKFKNNRQDKNTIFLLEEIRKCREFLSIPGASVKMILEHIALMI